MHKAMLQTKALHRGHPTLAHLPKTWHKFESNNITVPFPFKERKTVDAHDLIRVIHEMAHAQCQETNDVFSDEAMLGLRLLDCYSHRVKIETKAPLKPKKEVTRQLAKAMEEEFGEWRKEFERKLGLMLIDCQAIVVFSDGSQTQASVKGVHHARVQIGAAFLCQWWDPEQDPNHPLPNAQPKRRSFPPRADK